VIRTKNVDVDRPLEKSAASRAGGGSVTCVRSFLFWARYRRGSRLIAQEDTDETRLTE
jgi:hypothetical protein